MKIDTLGDLLRTTEAELLAYKNFGETTCVKSRPFSMPKACISEWPWRKPRHRAGRSLPDAEEDAGLLSKSVDELQLSVRAKKCLAKLNIRTLGDLVRKTEAGASRCEKFRCDKLKRNQESAFGSGPILRKLD